MKVAPPPPSEAFAAIPRGWYVFSNASEIDGKPLTRHMPWGEVVVWREGGRVVAMDARCPHLGANLGHGDVHEGCLVCPFHGWRFQADGTSLEHEEVALRRYAVTEERGRIYVQQDAEPTHELPSFGEDLVAARPFEFEIAAPYWMVGGNGFDLAHFRCAHDRRLLGEPTVSTPHPLARRISSTFAVAGDDWRDRVLRAFAGGQVQLEATVWAGTLALVRSQFRRSTTYGLVELRPIPAGTRVTVWIHVRRQIGGRALARLRANFVRAFLEPDVALLDEARYNPERLTAGDACLADFFRWLADASHGSLAKDDPFTGGTR